MEKYITTAYGIFKREGKVINRNGKQIFRTTDKQEYGIKAVKDWDELTSAQKYAYEAGHKEVLRDNIKTNILIHPEDKKNLERDLKNLD